MSKTPIKDSDLVVKYKGKSVLRLNRGLFNQQKCWGNLELIKGLHQTRLDLEELMLDGSVDMEGLAEAWTKYQFDLQKAWGFSEDRNFHRFWDIPACSCPKLDNNDNWPYGMYVKSGDCKVHGGEV